MKRSNIKFIKLTAIILGISRNIWVRPDLITKIYTVDNLTHISYLVNGEGGELVDYRISGTPETIIAEIEKINI